ncbi:MAG: extracellular solute-binding protein [Coprococcus phoceensis]
MKKTLQNIYLSLIIFLLYAPIVTLVVLSFNNSKTRAKWGGFTGKWYISLFQNEQIMSALYTTLVIALLSALIATLIGTAAAIGIQGMKRKSRTIAMGITNIPMLNADIVTGISLMLLFIAVGSGLKYLGINFSLGFATVLIAHITFNIPYVILSVMPKLKQTKRSTYEAALDLGASPIYAFFKVVFPDILPGVFSGFLLAFTMSLDDFVITHFTKGPGVDTLSTKIYSEVRKGIKPEMYALSTLLFVSVLILLILINVSPNKKDSSDKRLSVKKSQKAVHFVLRKVVPAIMAVVVIAGGIFYSSKEDLSGTNQVIVYNWGEYLDPEVITLFEKETGINVVYEEFETNEIMYPKVQSGAIAYDVVCPSDYMIQRMIENDLLAELNFDNIPNIKNIGQEYFKQSRQFDSENKYSVPYCWGTVGILYNKTMVDEPIDSWSVLWDEKYKDSILMQDSVRDAFAVALKYKGHSLNSTDLDELEEAKELLIKQKPLVQAYVIDQVRDKMIGNEAAIGVIYSGEAIYTQLENPDLEYVIPKEGSNVWIDSWVIPKNAKHKENAEDFINFLCRPDIAKMNFDYITYSTPNTAARELIEDPAIRNSKIAFPDASELERCETFQFLGDKNDAIYNKLWREIKSQ